MAATIPSMIRHSYTGSTTGSTAGDKTEDFDSKIVIQNGVMGKLYQISLNKQSGNVLKDKAYSYHGYTYEKCVYFTNHQSNDMPNSREKINNTMLGMKILCLYRFKIWWMRPIWVNSMADIPSETIMILFQAPTKSDVADTTQHLSITYHIYLAVPVPILDTNNKTVVSYTSSSFRGTGTNQNRTTTDNTQNDKDDDYIILCSDHVTTGMYVGSVSTNTTHDFKNDPYQLIKEGVQMASDLWHRPNQYSSNSRSSIHGHSIDIALQHDKVKEDIKDSSSRSKKFTDAGHTMHNTLGWCTWNAMETNVTYVNLLQSLALLCQKNDTIPIRWMIIDDGWQDMTIDKCNTNGSNSNNNKQNQNNTNGTRLTKYNGSQHHTARLQSFHEDYNKFPPNLFSLSATIDQMKRQFSIDTVLVWHALTGYWLGLQSEVTITNDSNHKSNNDTIRSQLHYPKFPPGIVQNDPSSLTEASVGLGIGLPSDIDLFYETYYNDLLERNYNIDGVKVDAQAITGILHASNDGDITDQLPSILLHTALTKNVIKNFVRTNVPAGELTEAIDFHQTITVPIIHCMAHSPEIFYRLPSLYDVRSNSESSIKTSPVCRPFFRDADDYYPNNIASHGAQIVACVYNTLLFGNLGIIPDWDMFTTTIPDDRWVRMHTIARCLSGGPIYISDNPSTDGTSPNNKILEWIACSDGTTFPCRQSGFPTISCLFADPLDYNSIQNPLIIWNTNGDDSMITSGIFGVFYLRGSGNWDSNTLDYVKNKEDMTIDPIESVTVTIQPHDIPIFSTERYSASSFVALRFFDKSATILTSPKDRLDVTLQYLQSESVSIIPIKHMTIGDDDPITIEYVVLGIRGKVNGAGAITRIEAYKKEDGSHLIMMNNVRGCGEFVMAFRLDRNRTDDTFIVPNTTVRINDIWLCNSQRHWNRRPQPNLMLNRWDAIDALQELDFDILSFDINSTQDRNRQNTVEVHLQRS